MHPANQSLLTIFRLGTSQPGHRRCDRTTGGLPVDAETDDRGIQQQFRLEHKSQICEIGHYIVRAACTWTQRVRREVWTAELRTEVEDEWISTILGTGGLAGIGAFANLTSFILHLTSLILAAAMHGPCTTVS
jgi:hypothetical protein